MDGQNADAEIGRGGEADVQSSTALLVEAQCETPLTLRQISFLALYSGSSDKLVKLWGS